MTWQSILTLLITNGVTLALGIYSTRTKYSTTKESNSWEAEGIYADHTKDLWGRLDKVSNELEETKHERDSLRLKVDTLQQTVDAQTTTIEGLRDNVGELKDTIKELTIQLEKLQEETDAR